MVEKKPGFDGEAQSLRNELVSLLGIKELNGLRLLNRYDVEGIDEALFEQCVPTVFSEPPVDNTYAELPVSDGVSFAVEYLPGQFDQPRRLCRRVHPAHQPGRPPAGALCPRLPAGRHPDR